MLIITPSSWENLRISIIYTKRHTQLIPHHIFPKHSIHFLHTDLSVIQSPNRNFGYCPYHDLLNMPHFMIGRCRWTFGQRFFAEFWPLELIECI